MKTIAQQLKIKEFPFIIKNADGKLIYWETSDGYWVKREYAGGKEIRWEDSTGYWEKMEWADGNRIYYENSYGVIIDNRPKTDIQKAIDLLTTEGLIVDGKILKN
jgi:hypothetical protein